MSPDIDPTRLLAAAAAASKQAYAPYSEYRVGAAVWTSGGDIIAGCNVENASYGLTNCAERTAVFAAVAAGMREFRAIAVVASGAPPPYPCGACRQVLAEFCAPDCPVFIADRDRLDEAVTTTVGNLLPHSFSFGPE